jgi:hypothetical protein
MAAEKYYRLSNFVPDGYPQVYPGMSDEVRQMMPALVEIVTLGWTKIPNHDDLEVFCTLNKAVPALGIRKKGKEVYLHVFCNTFMNPIYAMQLVIQLYEKYKFGRPEFIPEEENWIHTIPLFPADLNQAETLLTHQIAQSLFWTVYMDYKRNKGK